MQQTAAPRVLYNVVNEVSGWCKGKRMYAAWETLFIWKHAAVATTLAGMQLRGGGGSGRSKGAEGSSTC